MADRRQVREAAYSEMAAAVDGLNEDVRVSQSMPESEEQLPTIVHADDYRKVPMNQGSAAPHEKSYDSTGLAELVFYSMMEAQFTATVIHDDEQTKESIYEALRRHFERYEHPFWDTTDIHPDVHDVSVADSTSDDDSDREPVSRGDQLLLRFGYTRDYRVLRSDLVGTGNYESPDATFDTLIEEINTIEHFGGGIESWGDDQWGVGTWGGEAVFEYTTT